VTIATFDRQPWRLSVVIPVYNEADNVLPLLAEVQQAVSPYAESEIIFVDDGSQDQTAARLAGQADGQSVRLLRHRRRSGQSAAVRTGVKAARGTWVATLDGDGQNDPADIPRLIAAVTAAPPTAVPVLVGGLRQGRQASWSKRLASRLANRLRAALLRDDCPDTGCGLKLFRRDAFLDLPFFGALHRFLPALFRAYGYSVAFVPVGDRPRLRGSSKYGNLRRGLIGVVDLLGVYWLTRRVGRVAEVDETAAAAPAPAPAPVS